MFFNVQKYHAVTWHNLYCIFTHIDSLLIKEDLCKCWKIYQLSFRVLCWFICAFHTETSSFFIRVSLSYSYFCPFPHGFVYSFKNQHLFILFTTLVSSLCWMAVMNSHFAQYQACVTVDTLRWVKKKL